MGRKKIDWRDLPDGYDKYKHYIKSDDWKEVKDEVLNHYNHHCVCCGRTDNEEELYVHHNTYDFLYNELEHMDCVVPLCKVCHLMIHRNRRNWSRFKRPSN